MRSSRSLQIYSIFLIFLTTFTAAWPWPRWLPELDSLIVRQDSSNSTDTAQPTSTQDSASATATDNNPDDNTSGTITDGPTGSQTTTGTAKETGSITSAASTKDKSGSTKATTTQQTSFDATNPAGGISLITPAVASGSQYYKIGSKVTFAWNYTSLLDTPSAVNIMATCTANQQLYTIATNQTVGGNNTAIVTWDTGSYQATAVSDPLLTQTYTLIIYDAASSISATAQPGYLAVYDQYTFGMYLPQPYVGIDEGFVCATCSGALGETERRALGLMVGMLALTIFSFGWFVNGLGVVW